MTSKKTWFITGAGRGMGVDFAKAALAAGDNVVATGRDPDAVRTPSATAEDLLVVKLDVTEPARRRGGGRGRRRPLRRASTCWSTTPPASTRATSRS